MVWHSLGVRARVAWTLTLPFLVVGELAGHALAYRLVAPDTHERAALLARTGHGYLGVVPTVVGLCLALAAVAIVARLGAAFKGVAPSRVPSWRFAAFPSLAFALQEYVERLAHSGHVEWGTAAEPAVAVGIVVQVPCGLLVLWLVRALLRLAHAAGSAFAPHERPAWSRLERALWFPIAAEPLRLVPLARGSAQRGPPAFD